MAVRASPGVAVVWLLSALLGLAFSKTPLGLTIALQLVSTGGFGLLSVGICFEDGFS